MADLIIKFKSHRLMHMFGSWLIDEGEQDFSTWLEAEGEEPVEFRNHIAEADLIIQD